MTLKDLNQESDKESLKKHTDEIGLNEKHLSLIYDTLSDVIFLLAVEPDDCFRFVSVNQTFLAFTGLSREEVVGKRIEQVLPETAHALVISKYNEAINDNKTVFFEQASTFPSGEHVGVVTVTPVWNAGVCTHLVGTVQDLTEFRRAKKEILDLQRYNRELIEVSLDSLVTFNHEGCILDVNEATIQATGRSREELIGTPFADYFTDSKKAHRGVMMVFQTGEVRDYELVMKAKDGTQTFVSYNASVYKDQTGDVVGAFAAARDLTMFKRAEEALRESENRYHELFENANDLIQKVGLDGKILLVNKKWLETMEYSEEEVKGLWITDILREDQIAHTMEILQGVAKGETVIGFETIFITKNGKEIYVEGNGNGIFKDGKFIAALGAFRDITERKRMEKELQEKQKELDIIFNSVPAMIWSKNIEGKYLQVNRTYCEAVGLSREKILGRTDYDLYPTDIADQYSKYDQKIKNSRKPVSGIEERYLKPSGDYGWSLTEKMPHCNAEGNVVGTIGFALDITERKRAAEALWESEKRFRTIFDSINEAVFIHEVETGAILDVNTTMCEMYGYSREEVVQLDIQALSSGEVPYTQQDAFEWNKKAAMGEPQVFEWMAKHKSGHLFWVEVSMKMAVIGLQERLLVVVRNITERKRAEEELLERMNELEIFYRATLGREERVIELKQEVNQLLEQLGKNKKYGDYS